MNRRTLLAAGVALSGALALVSTAFAEDFTQGPITIMNPWARATAAAGATGGAFFELTTTGAADRLTGASTPVADQAQLHKTINDNGVMKMRPVDAIDIAPGTVTKLAPGGIHLMLIGLKQPLVKGSAFPLTLTFEKAGSVTVQVTVQAAGAGAPDDMAAPDMKGMKM
jgi:copper(I)-binding protein